MVTAACGAPAADRGTAAHTDRPTASTTLSPGTAGRQPTRIRAALASWRLPRPVSRAVAFTDGDHVLLVGGLIAGDHSIGDVIAFDPATGSHDAMADLPQPSHDAAGISLAGEHYLLGGGDAAEIADVQKVGTPSKGGIVGSLPQPRSDLAAAVVGDRAYVLGGYTGSSLPAPVLVTSDGRHFHPHGALAVPVRYAAVAATDDAIYLFGGLDSSGTPISDVQRYDIRTGHTRVIGHLPEPLSGASAMVVDGRILVAGGRLANGAATGAVLLWKHNRLHRVTRLRHPVANAASVVRGNIGWLLGGEAASDLSTVQTISVTSGGT